MANDFWLSARTELISEYHHLLLFDSRSGAIGGGGIHRLPPVNKKMSYHFPGN